VPFGPGDNGHIAEHNDIRSTVTSQGVALANMDATTADRVTDTDTLTGAALAETFVPNSGLVHASAVEVWGHSYAFGIGATDRTKRFGAVVARALNLPEVCEAISGSTLSYHTSGGSWPKVLQKKARVGVGAVSGSAPAATGISGFAGPGGLHILMFGVNDLNVRGNTAGALEGFKQDIRTYVSRLRAATVIESTNAAFSYTGTWATATDTTQNSGADYKYTTTGTGFGIALPADFPGGTLAVGFTAQTNAGAIYSTTVGSTVYTIDARNPYTVSSSYTGFVLRIPGLPAGAQTINFTVASIATIAIVDYAQWEGDDEPVIILVKQPYPVDYSAYGSTPPGPPTDAGVDAVNAIMDDVAAEFGARVIALDTSSLDRDASMFTSDGLHPSDKGNATIASLILTVLAGYHIAPIGQPHRPARVDYAAAVPSGTHTHYEVGDRVENTAPAAGGYVGWVCTTAGRPGTWKTYGPITV
jgi:lysophospholipase L1-like esterase